MLQAAMSLISKLQFSVVAWRGVETMKRESPFARDLLALSPCDRSSGSISATGPSARGLDADRRRAV